MPSFLSHPAVVVAAAGWFPSLRRGRILAVGALCSAVPDLDYFGHRWFGVPWESPLAHRGVTHSLGFAVLAGALVALPALRGGGRRFLASAAFFAFCFASHGLLDMGTDGGDGIAFFWPLSLERHFLPWEWIAVSPLGMPSDIGGWFAHVFTSELRGVWAPCVLVGALGWAVRRFAARRAAA